MTTITRRQFGPADEPFRDPRPDGPFVDRPGAPAIKPGPQYMLEAYARLANDVERSLASMIKLHESLRVALPMASANRPALAKPHIDALLDELASLEEAYGLELLNQ